MGHRSAGITELREIERLIEVDDPGPIVHPAAMDETFGAMFLAAIVHEDEFNIGHGAVHRQYAAFEQLHLIPEGNDDADLAL